jgi:hypothetical protein
VAARQLYTNRVAAATSTLTASSEQSGFPRRRVQDQARGATWRGAPGWNVKEEWNDWLPYSEGGVVKHPLMVAGNYPTGALYAAACQAAMNAVAAANTYSVTYDGATHKLTFARATGVAAFGLMCNLTGRTGWPDTGMSLVEKSGATSYLADAAAYKSREWVMIDAGSAVAVSAGVVLDHNLGASGTITLQGHTADTVGWPAPDVSQVLATDSTSTRRAAFFASASKRYWRILIDDVATGTQGYSELSLWWAGAYDDPSITFGVDYSKVPDQLSSVAVALSGAHYQDERAQQWVHQVSWLEVPDADRDKLLAWIAASPRGKNTFLVLDPINAPTVLLYGYFDGPPSVRMSTNLYWTISATFREALP